MMEGPKLVDWDHDNQVPAEMDWKEEATWQLGELYKLAAVFGMPSVVSTHRSKSIVLPVVRFDFEHGFVLVRDSFYDLNVAVCWYFAPRLERSDVCHGPVDWDWYLEQIERKTGYGGFNDFHGDPLKDPSWYWTCWSSGRLYFEGGMQPGCKIWRSGHCYLQGIEDVLPRVDTQPWEPGKKQFAVWLPLNYERIVEFLNKLAGQVPPQETE